MAKNIVILEGRLVRDPDVRYTNGEESKAVARFTLAIDRKGKDSGADFISCVAFGKTGELAEKYLKKGSRALIEGKIQTGSYDDKDGKKVYTTDVVVNEITFLDAKSDKPADNKASYDGFMNLPEGVDEELPFNQPSEPNNFMNAFN